MILFRKSLALLIMTLALILTGCGSDGSTSNNAEPEDPSVQTILDNASNTLAETETMKFNLEVSGDTWIDDSRTIRLLSARGNLARPDMVDVEFQVELLGAQNVSIRMISIGGDAWTTDLLSGNWQPSPDEFGYNPSVLFDNQSGLGPVAGGLNEPELQATEEIGGRDTWRISGTVDEATIEPLTSGTMTGDVIRITLWIDQSDFNILRLQVEEPESADKENPATWLMKLTAHNSDIQIERPELSE